MKPKYKSLLIDYLINPLSFLDEKAFLGNTFDGWILFIFSILGIIFINKIFFLLSVFWLENFVFWLIWKKKKGILETGKD